MKRFLAAVLAWTAFHASGQVEFGTLEELLAYADKNSIAIETAKQQEKIALSKHKNTKVALLPSVNGYAGFNNNITLQPTLVPANLFDPAAPEGTFNELTFGRKYMYSTGIQVSWDVLNFQKWFDVRASYAALELNEANTLHAKYQLHNQLAQTYYSILLTRKYLEISNENLKVTDRIYRIAEDNHNAGLFPEESLNRSRIQNIQAQQQLNGLTASLEQLYNQLQSQINTSETIVLTDDISANAVRTAASGSFAPHPEVVVQEAQVTFSREQLTQTKMLQYPVLSIGYQYNYNWAVDRMTDFSTANDLPQQLLGIKITVPVFNGLSTRSRISESKLYLQQQQMILENKKLVTQKEDDNLEIQYRHETDNFTKMEEILQLQYRNDAHSGNRYESGIIGLDERLDRFQELLQVQNQYMQSLGNLYINYYRLYLRGQF